MSIKDMSKGVRAMSFVWPCCWESLSPSLSIHRENKTLKTESIDYY